jgi:hypothetical protein
MCNRRLWDLRSDADIYEGCRNFAAKELTLLPRPSWRNHEAELRSTAFAGNEVTLNIDPASPSARNRSRSLDNNNPITRIQA